MNALVAPFSDRIAPGTPDVAAGPARDGAPVSDPQPPLARSGNSDLPFVAAQPFADVLFSSDRVGAPGTDTGTHTLAAPSMFHTFSG